MSHKLTVFLSKSQKESMEPYFIENNYSDGWYDYLKAMIINNSVNTKNTVSQCVESGKLPYFKNNKPATKDFSVQRFEKVKLKSDPKWEIATAETKSIITLQEKAWESFGKVFCFQNYVNKEIGIPVVKSVEELFHNIVINDVNGILSGMLATDLEKEFADSKPKKPEVKKTK